MQVQIRREVKSPNWEGTIHEYVWVDLASAICEILKSGEHLELMELIRDCGEYL